MSTERSGYTILGVGGLASLATLDFLETQRALVIDTHQLGENSICITSAEKHKPSVVETRAQVLEKWPFIIEKLDGNNRLLVLADLGTTVGCAAVLPLAKFAAKVESGFVLLMPSSLERERIFHAGVVYNKVKKWGHNLAVIEKDGLYSGLWELDVDSLEDVAANRLKTALKRLVIPIFSERREMAGPALIAVRGGDKSLESLVSEAVLELKDRMGRSEGWSEEGVVVASKSTPAAELAAALYQGREAWNAPFTYTLGDINENLVAALAVVTGPTAYEDYDPLVTLKSMEAEEGYDVSLPWGSIGPDSFMAFEL